MFMAYLVRQTVSPVPNEVLEERIRQKLHCLCRLPPIYYQQGVYGVQTQWTYEQVGYAILLCGTCGKWLLEERDPLALSAIAEPLQAASS